MGLGLGHCRDAPQLSIVYSLREDLENSCLENRNRVVWTVDGSRRNEHRNNSRCKFVL